MRPLPKFSGMPVRVAISLTLRPLGGAWITRGFGLGSATSRVYPPKSRRRAPRSALAPCAGIRLRSVQSIHHHGQRNPARDLAEGGRAWLSLASSRRLRTAQENLNAEDPIGAGRAR